ncbi:hypothetical protein O181_049625 [Austropuccinia psidii MF-1]|uniref:Uncharacterized protein n=1 Tax=Austropuccinia psidii MF-1 TaxID=1389203 RepID=A0A9Q3DTX2_9BASI|nr:hypothetical protein [Austropuccinia psidii MF-1]
MEDARTSTCSQRIASTFDTLIDSLEDEITDIPVSRPESFPTGNNRNIPVSVQELVYGGKAAGVRTSAKYLNRNKELIPSSEEVHGPRKDRGSSEGLDTHVLQRTCPTDKILVEKPKNVVRRPEEEVGPRKVKQPSGSSSSLHKKKIHLNKCKISARKPQITIRSASKGKGKAKAQVE